MENKEYKAAVISSITILETTFRELLERRCNLKGRYLSILSSMKFALEQEIIDESDYNLLREALHIRNSLVHSNGSINSKDARKTMIEVLKIIKKINSSQS